MSNIPEAREQLYMIAKLADPDTARRIRYVINKYMRRDPPVRRAAQKPIWITGQMKASIKALAANHPDMHISDIAAKFNINPGRVSEILNGKR